MKILCAILLLVNVAHAEMRIGDAARALDLSTLDGKIVNIEDLRGKVTVVDFFATWCAPCHEALRHLVKVDKRVQLVIIDSGEDPQKVRDFFAHRPLPPNTLVLLDPDRAAGRRWGQKRFPTTFILDAEGVVRHINRGYGPGYAARITGWIERRLGP